MNKLKIVLLFSIGFMGCKNEIRNAEMEFLTENIPNEIPLDFKMEIVPDDKIIHKGVFNPSMTEYYYTLSDPDFKNFEVYVIRKENEKWSKPEEAFFNSTFDEHGMNFSPDGNTLYFSSTRPVNIEGIPATWHIWKSDKINGEWNEPTFVDIPNLRNRLVSHPTITNSGTLYFHSSNLDYSVMEIYHSRKLSGKFSDAKKISIPENITGGKCTPFVSPKEDYLIFASIGNQLDLMISFNDGKGQWVNTRKLNNKINDSGQGNPYITPDNKFLFFTTAAPPQKKWKVKWVNIAAEIENN